MNRCAGRTLHDFEIQAKQKIRYFISPLNMGRDGTLTPELMAVNPESIPSRAKVETITHSLSA